MLERKKGVVVVVVKRRWRQRDDSESEGEQRIQCDGMRQNHELRRFQ